MKNRLDVLSTLMSFRDPHTWWILRLLPHGQYTVSIRLLIRAKKVSKVSTTNIFGDVLTLILSRKLQLAPYQKCILIIVINSKLVNGKSQLTTSHLTRPTLDWITFPMVPHWQLSVGRAHCAADQQLRRTSTSRYLTDSWLLVGGAHGTTDQWLRKTCCLVTGCGVVRHSSGYFGYFPGGSDGKASAYNVGDLGSIPGSGRSPGEEMATHSSILAWKIPCMEEPGRLQSMGSPRLRFDWVISLHFTSLLRPVLMLLLHKDSLGPVCWNLFD